MVGPGNVEFEEKIVETVLRELCISFGVYDSEHWFSLNTSLDGSRKVRLLNRQNSEPKRRSTVYLSPLTLLSQQLSHSLIEPNTMHQSPYL